MEVEGRPEFFGKCIDHEWTEGWLKGTVTAVFDDDDFETDCEFKVEYDWYNNFCKCCKLVFQILA